MLDTLILTPGSPEAGTEIIKPEIRVIESEDTYGKVAVEPLPRDRKSTRLNSSHKPISYAVFCLKKKIKKNKKNPSNLTLR